MPKSPLTGQTKKCGNCKLWQVCSCKCHCTICPDKHFKHCDHGCEHCTPTNDNKELTEARKLLEESEANLRFGICSDCNNKFNYRAFLKDLLKARRHFSLLS